MRDYTPLFNGSLLACNVDEDCPPPNAVCLDPTQASWLASDRPVCGCPTIAGLEGPECKSLNSAAWFVFACSLLGILVCLYALLLIGRVVRAWRIRGTLWRRDAAHTSFLLTGFSTLGFCVYFPLALASPFLEFSLSWSPADDKIRRVPRLLQGQNTLLAFVLFFGLAGQINLSLAWLAVAKRIGRGRRAVARNLAWMYVFLALVYLLGFLVALIALISTTLTRYAGFLVLPGVYFVACAFFAAAAEFARVARRTKSMSSRMEASTHLILRTALTMAALMTVSSVLLTVLASLGNRYDANPPGRLYQGCLVAAAELLFVAAHARTFKYLLDASLNAMKTDSSSVQSPPVGMLSGRSVALA